MPLFVMFQNQSDEHRDMKSYAKEIVEGNTFFFTDKQVDIDKVNVKRASEEQSEQARDKREFDIVMAMIEQLKKKAKELSTNPKRLTLIHDMTNYVEILCEANGGIDEDAKAYDALQWKTLNERRFQKELLTKLLAWARYFEKFEDGDIVQEIDGIRRNPDRENYTLTVKTDMWCETPMVELLNDDGKLEVRMPQSHAVMLFKRIGKRPASPASPVVAIGEEADDLSSGDELIKPHTQAVDDSDDESEEPANKKQRTA